ncbi:hypothetical protein D3C87_1818070 [compost metagenome]
MFCQRGEDRERTLAPKIINHHVDTLCGQSGKLLGNTQPIIGDIHALICAQTGQNLRIASGNDDFTRAMKAGNLHRELTRATGRAVDQHGFARL